MISYQQGFQSTATDSWQYKDNEESQLSHPAEDEVSHILLQQMMRNPNFLLQLINHKSFTGLSPLESSTSSSTLIMPITTNSPLPSTVKLSL